MHVIHSVPEMHNWVYMLKKAGRKIGFVPTLGYLHKGHLDLLKQARAHCDVLVVSIFVNPTQFGPGEDYAAYPRDLKRDMELAQWAQVDCLFLPEAAEMYGAGYRTFVEVESLSGTLCGPFRPGHFRGVCTVLAKLFNIVGPDEAWLGDKDAQQLRIVRRMVADLCIPVKITSFPVVREPDGLAFSSRNVYLSEEERRQAAALHRALTRARDMAAAGETDAAVVLRAMQALIDEEAPAAHIEYIQAVDDETLADVPRLHGRVLIALAVRLGRARLIDNTVLDMDALSARGEATAHARG